MPRRLGQHFLIRDSILERIAASVDGSGLVIEIGPGRGALTRHLLEHAARVIAIEVDPNLIGLLKGKFDGDSRLTIVNADVLDTDLTQWGPASIAGNLPYYITSPILRKFFALGPEFPMSVFLVQHEVAERLVAGPGSRDYGYLSVETQLYTEPELLFTVPPAAFHPPPKVDSAVVRLVKHPPKLDAAEFLKFVGRCFAQKRKTLRNNLLAYYGKQAVEALPEARLRAEQLSLAQFEDLYRRCRLTALTG